MEKKRLFKCIYYASIISNSINFSEKFLLHFVQHFKKIKNQISKMMFVVLGHGQEQKRRKRRNEALGMKMETLKNQSVCSGCRFKKYNKLI